MLDISIRRIPFTLDSENRFRTLQSRTGIQHRNILCRMGFCLSLEEPGIPAPFPKGGKVAFEIDRFTLLGQHSLAYLSLLAVWMKDQNFETMDLEKLESMLVAHMNRGIDILTSRIRSLGDMASLFQLVAKN